MNQQCEHAAVVVRKPGRRKFLKLAAMAGGVSLLTTTPWLPGAQASGAAEALLLSCMDYRLIDDTEHYMSERGLRNKYDHVVLAGASLGAVSDKCEEWHETFWEHLDIAIKLHGIHRVIVLDHRDCGAYKVFLGPEHAKDPQTEKQTHAAQLAKLRSLINEKHPTLEVETLLMALDGSVETVA